MLEKMLALQNKRKKEGGFTLVELIVVLVILAILAALLIPALTGYINKAKEKSITAETRQVVMAAQTLVDEEWAKSSSTNITIGDTGATITKTAVTDLAEVTGTINSATVENGKVTTLSYTSGGKTCVYTAANADKYAVS